MVVYGRIIPVAFAAAALGSGCVAFNVGEPKTLKHSETVIKTDKMPFRTEVVSVCAWGEQTSGHVVVGLAADTNEEFLRRSHKETYTIREQRRLAVGLYPGGGEIFLMPKDAFQSSVLYNESEDRGSGVESLPDPGQYLILQSLGMVATLGIPHAFCTAYSLFVAPFDNWDCHHERFSGAFAKEMALQKFSSEEIESLESKPHSHWYTGRLEPFSHCGILGCHKYIALFVDGPQKGPASITGTVSKFRHVAVAGPFTAELSIPSLQYKERKNVSKDETRAFFQKPLVKRDCTVEAILSFHDETDKNERGIADFTRQAIQKATGRTWRFDLELLASDRVGSPPVPQQGSPTVSEASKTPRDQGSTQDEGWFYDQDSRRGWMRIAVPEGIPADEIRKRARENIIALVSEKNILIKASLPPPSDATYRTLGESFENGLLIIEFEATP